MTGKHGGEQRVATADGKENTSEHTNLKERSPRVGGETAWTVGANSHAPRYKITRLSDKEKEARTTRGILLLDGRKGHKAY